jgi:hypothetical protein
MWVGGAGAQFVEEECAVYLFGWLLLGAPEFDHIGSVIRELHLFGDGL